jgi:hypothetical protein
MAFGFIKGIAAILAAIWHFLFNAFTHYDQVSQDVEDIAVTVRSIIDNVKAERARVKEFKFDPKWKTRVISVPAAVENIQELRGAVLDAFAGKMETLYQPIHEFSLIFKTEAIEQGDPQQAVSALSKAEVKLGHLVTFIAQTKTAVHEIADFVDLFQTLRDNAEGLDVLFLPQGSLKTVVDVRYRKRNA